MTLRPLAAAGVFALCLTATAQPPAEKKDPQNSFEPRSKPGAGQEFLKKFVGDWDVVKTFHPRNGDPVSQKGECVQAMTHEGRFLRSEFTFRGGAGVTTGTGLIGFESDSGWFTSVWTDARATRMSFRRSKDKFDGSAIVLYGTQLEGGDKEARKSKTATRLEDNGTVIVHKQYGYAADGTERVVMELRMSRKATPAK